MSTTQTYESYTAYIYGKKLPGTAIELTALVPKAPKKITHIFENGETDLFARMVSKLENYLVNEWAFDYHHGIGGSEQDGELTVSYNQEIATNPSGKFYTVNLGFAADIEEVPYKEIA